MCGKVRRLEIKAEVLASGHLVLVALDDGRLARERLVVVLAGAFLERLVHHLLHGNGVASVRVHVADHLVGVRLELFVLHVDELELLEHIVTVGLLHAVLLLLRLFLFNSIQFMYREIKKK